ncbi:putative lipid II flippase FtsW [Sansalvadorimonas verongulae]|uniref:putative lipid II flippase FtsW n=1 Tax=Sansalvadorimonas verongulae TaxID=2172824 RepID=UPI0012BCC092|nr:putative lipid II flippase FtsW [Sansalvadorimonas verongulae]MTI15243.1 putative lipid II flippase FtsW [Sansalvadorimonas verongulae]
MASAPASDLYVKLSNARHPIDIKLLAVVACCMAIGLVMVGSASSSIATANYGDPFYFLIRQTIFMTIGVIVLAGTTLVPIETWRKMGFVPLIVSVLLLVTVLLIGREINGSKRWLPLGIFNLQPSEVVKVAMVIFMAFYLSKWGDKVCGPSWIEFFKPIACLGVVLIFLLIQPDFGSSVVIASSLMGMIFLAGARIGKFFVLLVAGGIGAGYLIYDAPYRLKRLNSFTDPWADQFGSGYQLTQSLIGFGRGGWSGEGLGHGIQKLFFLPEAHTDFIFSVIAEELGLVGGVCLIALLFFVSWRGLRIGHLADRAGQKLGAYMAYGIGLLFGAQVFINIGVSSGLLPTKGLALPFVSYGGSSLIMNCMAVGLLMRIDFERRTLGAVKAVKKKRGGSSHE